MSVEASDLAGADAEAGRPFDAWPDDVDSDRPPDPAVGDDRARGWAECNSDLARHLASIPEPPDSAGPPPVTALEFAEETFAGGPDGAAAVLAGVDPGARSAALMAMLDPARVTPASMVGVIAATEKLASWVQALQHRWLAAFTVPGVAASREGLLAYASSPGQPLHRASQAAAGSAADSRGGPGGGVDGVGGGEADLPFSGPAVYGDAETDRVIDEAAFKVAAAEVSAALHFSPVTAQRRVRQALDFTIDLPDTLQALSLGQIDRGRALTILDRTENLPVDLRRKVETAVLPKAISRTPGQLRGIVDRAVISVDPAAAKKRQIKAREERHVTVRPNRDGMSAFIAELPAEHAGVAFSVLDRVATTLHRNRGEGRRIGALRADVFSDIFDQLATQGSVDLRATLGGRAVITHDPLRWSWISDADTIAGRFDPDTSLLDPNDGNPDHTDTGATDMNATDVAAPVGEPDADAGPTHGVDAPVDLDVRFRPATSDPANPAGEADPADAERPTEGDMRCSPAASGSGVSAGKTDPVGPDNQPSNSAMQSASKPPGSRTSAGSADDGRDSVDWPRRSHASDPRIAPAATDSAAVPPTGSGSTITSAGDDDAIVVFLPAFADDDDDDDDVSLDPEPGATASGGSAGHPAAHRCTDPNPPEEPTAAGPGTSHGPGPANSPGEHAPAEVIALAGALRHPADRPFVFPTQQGRLTHLNVTIAATTLAGLDDLPGELDGHGPIPADVCRALAVSAASITAIAVHPACGTALDLGRTAYRPRLSHRDHVTQRDRTCRFPGCRQPARRCQIDHSEEFCHGGATCPCNLSCLCKFHHDLKTTGLWDAEQHPDASIIWTSPTGRKYRTRTPEWPIAAPRNHPEQGTSMLAHAEACDTGGAAKHVASASAATDEPPF